VAENPAKLLESSRVSIGQPIEELDTPTILADLDRMERNIHDWQSWMDERGVRFRVHIKTHKVPEIALLQLQAGARGICCAKISEAEPFAAVGIDDIALAYPIFGEEKWRHVAEMAGRGVRMTANTDSEEGARQASEAATAAGVTINLQIDVDSGMHRGGIPEQEVDRIEALARLILQLAGLDFDGLTTHRSYFFAGKRSRQEEGHTEGALLVDIAERLRARGIEVKELSAGGSFTGKYVAEVPGITESRAGTYVFYDLMHVYEGSATEDQVALSALCRVNSLWGDGGLTIDGGTKTFSGDRGVVGTGDAMDPPPAMSKAVDRGVVIERLTEEHGMGRAEEPVKLGDKIRFYPYHACTCCNLTNDIVGFRDGKVETVWQVAARGLRQ
jgi:D-serine deaminase-like pyridoxal phosphate-dependent protein